MKLPEYVTVEEVRRVCKELNISDWTEMKESRVSLEEAKVILSEVTVEDMDIQTQEFCHGLDVQLDNGLVPAAPEQSGGALEDRDPESEHRPHHRRHCRLR